MTEDKTLVEQLRSGDYYPDGDIGYHEISPGKVDALCEQAADRIEALNAENARLREALDWALNEIRCSTRYDDERQFWNCYDIAREALGEQP